MTYLEYLRQAPLPNRERWDHQVEGVRVSCEKAFHFLSCEQRTGKTQIILDTAGLLYLNQKINTLVIPSMPSGAPYNWRDEINAGMLPPSIPRLILRWDPTKVGLDKNTGKPKNKSYMEWLQRLRDFEGLAVLVVNGESTITKNFTDYCYKLMKKRPTMMACDETTLLMKTPGAARTKSLWHLGHHAKYRRCLDGTPAGEGPFDLFSQYRFLSNDLFGTEFSVFRNRYAVIKREYNAKTGSFYDVVDKDEDERPIYQNLDKLQTIIEPHTYRVRFFDVFKNVPQPIYRKAFVELTPKQRELYEKLELEYEVEIKNLGKVSVANVLTRYLRLQQITAGFWPSAKLADVCEQCLGEGDDCHHCGGLGIVEHNVPLQRLVKFEENPRLLALKDDMLQNPAPAIIWARFNQELDDVMQLLREMGRKPVRYDGTISDEQKHKHKAMFQAGDATDFVAKTRSAGRAVNVSRADRMFYYSSEFGLNQRLQSEVRPLTGERKYPYDITDLVAPGTKDELILRSHRERRKLSDILLNETSGGWL